MKKKTSKKKYAFPSEEDLAYLSQFVLRNKKKNLPQLRKAGLGWLKAAWKEKVDYEMHWLGVPIIQNPYDMMRMQDLIFRLRPDVIVETGIAHGGSLIYYASLCKMLGVGRVIGIDVDIRKHNRDIIETHPMYTHITMLEASSTDPKTVSAVRTHIKKGERVLVLLDSHHTHDHVLRELELYAPLVTKGSYMVAFDTIHEYFPKSFFADRPWGVGNSAGSAVKAFLKKHKAFRHDQELEDKFVLTEAPGGWLERIR